MKVTPPGTIPHEPEFWAPASKSEALRALVLATLAGRGRVLGRGPWPSDVRVLVNAIRALGADLAEDEAGFKVRTSVDDSSIAPCTLDFADGGAPLRLGLALAATLRRPVRAVGSPRLSVRPLAPLLAALRDLGARIEGGPGLPVVVQGPLRGGLVSIDSERSSQFASALLLVGSSLPSGLQLHIPGRLASAGYLELTRQMMAAYGVTVGADGLVPPGRPGSRDFQVPGDWSAGIALAAAAAFLGRPVRVMGLDPDSTQPDRAATSHLSILGVHLRTAPTGWFADPVEPAPGRLQIEVGSVPDAVPPLVALALLRPARTVFCGAAHLADKESDRRQSLVELAESVGGRGAVTPDGLWVEGPLPGQGARIPQVSTHGDHRIAMAAALIALRQPLHLDDPDCVSKSFPGFWPQWPTKPSPA